MLNLEMHKIHSTTGSYKEIRKMKSLSDFQLFWFKSYYIIEQALAETI